MTRTQMICILEYINNHSSKFLARTFFQHCDQRLIKFLVEIVINVLDGTLKVGDKKPFYKYRPELQGVYNIGKKAVTTKKLSKTNLQHQRAVLSSPRGLKLVNTLFNTVQNRQFSH